MAPAIVHLPNGTNLTVTPVFGGLFFKSNELSKHPSAFPPGWTVVLHCEDEEEDHVEYKSYAEYNSAATSRVTKIRHIHRFKKPTLRNDHLYISSISNPSSSEFKPASSPTRQIAMMLWATLWWYFHQPEPNVRLNTSASEKTPDPGKPKGDWRININREGIFKGKVVLPKLERMGLIASEDSCVGADQDERSGEGWLDMFVSRRSFWQLDARIYLFTLSPMANSPYPSGSPYQSRPSSPSGEGNGRSNDSNTSMPQGLWSPSAPGPFHSSSHLPTYYPPPPAQYIFTNDIRHPLRQKPPRQGETFYTRYVPSCEQYISFRVACLSNDPPKHHGPVSSLSSVPTLKSSTLAMANSFSDSVVPTVAGLNLQMCDPDLLHKWMNDPRISYYWGEDGPRSHQETFLRKGLRSKHSFPVIGCWDGKPFGYFEIYWVKEDALGKHLGGDVGDFDRGIHCLVGEQEYRGAHRVRVWLSALVHYCWLADNRTETVILEPRVDNDKLKTYLEEVGFYKEREISFPHKQSNLMKIKRDAWEAPCL